MIDLNNVVDELLDMKPDPIPEFILLKEFKGLSPNSRDYQNAYDRVCNHPFVRKIENEQNERGFWPPFHGNTENIIRRCLSIGLEKDHPCLKISLIILKKCLKIKKAGINSKNRTISAGGRKCLYRLSVLPCFH